jgi:hypothetical protein
MKKIALAAMTLLLVAFVYPALAIPSVDMHLTVMSADLAGGCSGGAQMWNVASEITVQNTSEQTVTFESTDFWSDFTTPGSPGQRQDDVSASSADGFQAGTTIDPNATSTFHPQVQVSLPCDTSGANLFGGLKLAGRDKFYSASDAFIEGGTPVPVGPTGILGIAVVLGIAGLLGQGLSRRPKPFAGERRGL